MKTLLPITSALVATTLAISSGAAAQSLLADGELAFDYQQFPTGAYGGTFSASGPIADPSSFPPGSGAAYGVFGEVEGVHYLLVVGGILNVDSTIDAAFLLIRNDNPITLGIYPVDTTDFRVGFGYLDDATALPIPGDPWALDLQAWADLLVAEHVFVGVNGAITIEEALPGDTVAGTFTGLMGEYQGTQMLAGLTNGSFRVGPVPLAVESTSWGSAKSSYRARP